MQRHTLTMLSVLSLIPFHVQAETYSTQDFVTKASTANQFEIDAATIALQKSQSADVKQFASKVKTDHEATKRKLTAVVNTAQSKNDNDTASLQLSTELDRKHQEIIDTLEASSNADFDERYIDSQTTAHREAVNLFSAYARSGKDPEIKSFANETLPILQGHLSHVKELQESY